MSTKEKIHERTQARMLQVLFVTWVGLWVNVVVCTAKVVAGVLGNSYAVIADGVHSLSDLITDLAIIVGAKKWAAPADDDHQYGHQRLESLISLLIGVVLGGAGVGIAYDAFIRMGQPRLEQVGSTLALGVIIFSMISKEALYHWTKRKGQELKSSAVEANAWDHRSDVISSLPVALAVIISLWFPRFAVVDLWGTLIVACFIVYAAWQICLPAVQTLLDKSADAATHEKLSSYVRSIPGVLGVHRIRSRYLGQALGIDMHVQVNPNLSVGQGNEIAHRVEESLYSEEAAELLGIEICDALVHIDPLDPGDL